MEINKTYYRKFGSGYKQPFRIIKFVRGSNKTKAYIEVYEKSNKAWKQKTQSFVLSEILAKENRKTHRLYKEYISLLNDDMDFYNAWEDTDEDFYEWVMSYEIDNDWKKEAV